MDDQNIEVSLPEQAMNPEIPVPSSNFYKWTLPFLVIASMVALFIGWEWYQAHESADYAYTIPGVPTLNMYNSEVLNAPTVIFPRVADLVSIMRYWGDDVSLTGPELSLIASYQGVEGLAKLQAFFQARGYTVQVVSLRTPQDLEKYINPSRPIPLLFPQLVSPDNLEVTDDTILIGIDLKKGVIITNDFLHGQTYTMSLADFQHLWDIYPASSQYDYIAIFPTDPKRITTRVEENATAPAYPPRTAPMDTLAPILPTYLASMYGFGKQQVTFQNLTYLNTLIDSPLFSEFHPVLQSFLYARRAYVEIGFKHMQPAFADLTKAIALDQNLDTPLSGWGQFNRKQIPVPYIFLSLYYGTIGDTQKAAAAAAKAQEIASSTLTATPNQFLQ